MREHAWSHKLAESALMSGNTYVRFDWCMSMPNSMCMFSSLSCHLQSFFTHKRHHHKLGSWFLVLFVSCQPCSEQSWSWNSWLYGPMKQIMNTCGCQPQQILHVWNTSSLSPLASETNLTLELQQLAPSEIEGPWDLKKKLFFQYFPELPIFSEPVSWESYLNARVSVKAEKYDKIVTDKLFYSYSLLKAWVYFSF